MNTVIEDIEERIEALWVEISMNEEENYLNRNEIEKLEEQLAEIKNAQQ